MQSLDLQFKPDDTMRICLTPDCGEILEGARKYCLECLQRRKMKQINKSNERIKRLRKIKVYPVYHCDNCNSTIQLNFYPNSNSHNWMKFEQIKKEHQCLK